MTMTMTIIMTMRASHLFTCSSVALLLVLISILIPVVRSDCDVVFGDETVPGLGLPVQPVAGRIRYHYDTSVVEPCASVVIIGVGTAMTTGDYDEIAKDMTKGQNVTAIISDPVPGLPVKLSAMLFARQVNAIVHNIVNLIPSACGNVKHAPRMVIIGGHSASGSAAFRAVLANLFTGFEPAGFLGLDPWPVRCNNDDDDKYGTMQLPSMYWGFSQTTCWVNVANAAKAAYSRTNHEHRVLVQIQNDNPNNNSTAIMKHCSFTDTGCPACGIDHDYNTQEEVMGIREGVGSTLRVFLQAVVTDNFDRSLFEEALSFKVATKLFVGRDNVTSSEENTRWDLVPA